MSKTVYYNESVMKKHKTYKTMLSSLVVLFIIFAPVIACADWGFSMGEDGWNPAGTKHYNMRKIEFFIPDVPQNAGITWSGQGVTDLSVSGWSATKVNPTYVVASGPSAGTIYWDALFTGTAPSEFRLDYLVYDKLNKKTPVFAISMNIVNGVPSFTQGSGWIALDPKHLPDYNRNPVPLPPTVWLLGAGLVGAIAFRKKISL